VPNPDNLSAFAAQRMSDGALTVMVISKVLKGDTPLTLNVSGFSPGWMAQAWQLTAANTITRLRDVPVSAGTLRTVVPSQSVTLFVIPSGSRPGNQPPVAKLTATPTSGNSPLTVAFSAMGSTDPDGALVTHAWDFGDGQKATGVTVSHTYTQRGAYTATLTVKDNNGATASASVPIQVTATPVEAPTNLYTQLNGSDVTLHWTDNSRTQEGFIIERGLQASPLIFRELARVGANTRTFVDRQVAPGRYYYRVIAFAGALRSTPSNMDGEKIP
jgi:hypothetical protein